MFTISQEISFDMLILSQLKKYLTFQRLCIKKYFYKMLIIVKLLTELQNDFCSICVWLSKKMPN